MPEPITRRLAIRTGSSNDEYNADFDYALVEISPAILATIQLRRELFIAAAVKDRALTAIRFYDVTPSWFSGSDMEQWGEDQAIDDGEKTNPWIDMLESGDGFQEVPEGFDPAKIHGPDDRDFRSDCDSMEISDSGVTWSCNPKHTGIDITTYTLSWEDLGLEEIPHG